MSEPGPAKVAFMILSDDPDRAVPGLVMATRLKSNRNVDVRVLFFGPGVKLAASGKIDDQLQGLRSAGIGAKACTANVEQYGVTSEIASRPLELLAAGAEVEDFARNGYTVLSF
ncbi:MAG: DsrE family protein [Actinobacteria bacterium]|nr:DsrE family protein [Actinomycetota bacterium]